MNTKMSISIPDAIYMYCKKHADKYFNGNIDGYLTYVIAKEKERKEGRIVRVYDGNMLGEIDAKLVKKIREKADKEYWVVDTGIGYNLERWISKSEIEYTNM
ncbi:hypothetical protein [Clostridium ganghwense]|uniref:Uncharacterized protein n=1 Tax=Clostridium ganghwense TaxID=312089 RepID=A0ABT4CT77_9CLOT|nr:hypothetical protein [Clostridium ganghwense]MCY6372123.1 hypothetical protein [Clostridium ganghwense]